MTLRHFSIFICVCRENGITAAARKLHITQPSVSQAIRELEEHYNILLFERLGRRLFLTAAGQRLLTYAQNIIHLNLQTEEAMHSFNATGKIRVGASITIGESLLIDVLKKVNTQYPQAEILSQIHNSAVLEEMLLNNKLDLALIEGSIHSDHLQQLSFLKDELIFIASCNNQLAIKNDITPIDLQKQKFFVREAGSGTRELFEKNMQDAGIPYDIVGIYNSAETIKKAVSANLGISVISKRAVLTELHSGELISFSLPNIKFSRCFWLAYHKDKFITNLMQSFIDSCRQIPVIV